ncbi:MAG: hypothetical protein IT580_07035 [Verrucomicrobiales bacterium]|nr:hypothetical protein [Verrucomicrobiales bacterium]
MARLASQDDDVSMTHPLRLASRLLPAPRSTLFIGLLFLILVGVGCNTTHGLGKDIEKTGDWIQKEAK